MTHKKHKEFTESFAQAAKESLFITIHSVLLEQLQEWQQFEPLAQRESQLPATFHMLRAILQTLTSFAEWLPLDLFLGEHGLPHMLRAMLPMLEDDHVAVRRPVAEILLVLLTRGIKQSDIKYHFLMLFEMTQAWSRVLGAANAMLSDTIMLQLSQRRLQFPFDAQHPEYIFFKRLSQAACVLILLHSDILNAKKLPDNYNTFLELVLDISRHHSLVVVSSAIPVWRRLIVQEQLQDQPFFSDMCRVLLTNLSDKMVAWGHLRSVPSSQQQAAFNSMDNLPPGLLSQIWSAIDFEDIQEHAREFAMTRGALVPLFESIAKLQPVVYLSFLQNQLQYVSSLIASDSGAPILTQTRCWDAFAKQVETGCRGICASTFDPVSGNPAAIQIATLLVQTLLGLSPSHPVILHHLVNALRSFTPFFEKVPEALIPTLTKILNLVPYGVPEGVRVSTLVDQQGAVSNAVHELREKACTSVIYIASRLPHLLLPHWGALMQEVDRLVGQDKVFPREKIYLMECLTGVAVSAPPQERVQLLQLLGGNQVQEWSSDFVTNIVSEPFNLLTFLGVQGIMKLKERGGAVASLKFGDQDGGALLHELTQLRQDRNLLVTLLRAVVVLYRQTANVSSLEAGSAQQHPLAMIDLAVLPNVFRVVQSVHALRESAVRSQVEPHVPGLYQVNESLVKAFLRQDQDPDVSSSNTNSQMALGDMLCRDVVAEEEKRIVQIVDLARETAYQIIGHAAQHVAPFWEAEGLLEAFTTQVVTHVSRQGILEMARCIRDVFRPLVTSCPPARYPDLWNVLKQVCYDVAGSISSAWAALGSGGGAAEASASGRSSEQLEVVQSHVTSIASHEFVLLLQDIILGSRSHHHHQQHDHSNNTLEDESSHNTTGSKKEYSMSDVFRAAMENRDSAWVIACVVECMRWGDSRSLTVAIHTLHQIINDLAHSRNIINNAFPGESVDSLSEDNNMMIVLCRDGFSASLKAILPPSQYRCHPALALMHDMWKISNQFPRQVLSTIPNVTTDVIDSLAQQLKSAPKSRSNVWKRFVESAFDVELEEAGKSLKKRVLDVPEHQLVDALDGGRSRGGGSRSSALDQFDASFNLDKFFRSAAM
jgi:hypothetical protein